MRRIKGLTLIELLIVVIILGVLAAIAIPRITTSATTAKENACRANVDSINKAIEMYNLDKGSYPAEVEVVTTDPCYFPDGPPVCLFGYDYLWDPSIYRVPFHTH